MPRHIVKGSKVLLDEHGVSDAVLSYSFVRIDPVPPEWEYLLQLDANDIENDDGVKFVTSVADALTKSLASRGTGTDVSHRVVVREGSMEIYTFLVASLISVFGPDIRQALIDAYNNNALDPLQARKIVKKIQARIAYFLKRSKNYANTLRDVTRSVFVGLEDENQDAYSSIGLEDANQGANPPIVVKSEGRNGALNALIKFQDNFTTAKFRGASAHIRCKSLESALGQARTLNKIFSEVDDRELIHMYLHIRTRDIELFLPPETDGFQDDQVIAYNKAMKAICDIRDEMKPDETDTF